MIRLKCDGCVNDATTVLTTGVPRQITIPLCATCRAKGDLVPLSYSEYTLPEFFKQIGAKI
jgi:hypothetical protein